MIHMGFVQKSDNSELDAVQSVWHHLQPSTGQQEESKELSPEGNPDNGERVVAEHLKIFMAAILGFHIGAHADSSNGNPDLIGTLDETTGEYALSASEQTKVHKRYHQLSSNRMDHQMRQRREKQQERISKQLPATELHRPQLSQKSLDLAKKSVPKMETKDGKKQIYADYLIQRGQEYEHRREEKAALIAAEKEDSTQCTFRPSIRPAPVMEVKEEESPETKNNQPKPRKNKNKWDQLYNSGLERANKKENKTAEQIEWEKSRMECKFIPEVHEVNLIGKKKPSVVARPKPGSVTRKMQSAFTEKLFSPTRSVEKSPVRKDQSKKK